jgi:hypothetical protein
MSNTIELKKSKNSLVIYTLVAILFTTFLFFIDEGYYNFNWVFNWGSWVVFALYSFVIFVFQIIVEVLVPHKWAAKSKIPISFIIAGGTILLALNIVFTLFTKG